MRLPWLVPLVLLAGLAWAPVTSRALSLVPGATQRPSPNFFPALRTLGAAEGLPQNTAFSMARAADGYVYVGTQAGLARYDGVGFERVPLPDGDSAVWRLLADGDTLWIGTIANGLWRLRDSQLTEARSAEGERLQQVVDIQRAHGGGVWVASRTDLLKCSATDCSVWLAKTEVTRVAESRIGQETVLWFGVDTEGVYALPASAPPVEGWRQRAWHASRKSGLPANTLRGFAQWAGPKGQDIWLGLGLGLVRIRVDVNLDEGFAAWRAASQHGQVWRSETHPGMAGVQVLQVETDEDGQERLVAGVFSVGIGHWYADGSFDLMTVRDGLPDAAIFSLMRTGGARGPLWVGTGSSGIVRLEPGLFKILAEPDGLPNRNVLGIGEAAFANIGITHWLGTASGLVTRQRNGVWRTALPPPWQNAPVYALTPRRAGGLWLATDAGLLSLADNEVKVRNLSNSKIPGLAVGGLAYFAMRGEERLWLTTRHGVAWVEDDSPVRATVAGVDLTPGARGLVLAPEIAGGSLFVVQNGINWIRADGTAESVNEACLGHKEVSAATVSGKTLWIAGRGGIRRLLFDDKRLTCDAVTSPVLTDVWVNALKALPNGDVFVLSARGGYRLRVSQLGGQPISSLRVTQLGASDALTSQEFRHAVYVDAAGRLWAANAAGAVMLPPDTVGSNDTQARLVLKSATSNNRTLEPDATLPYGSDVALEWRLLSFVREAHIRYRWQLTGLNQDSPDTWSRDARIHLPRLPARRYQLNVWARDANDAEYGPLIFRFTIDKPWWQREWLIMLVALALVACGVTIGRLRGRIQRERAAQLEAVVRTRTRELSQANQRLEQSAMTDVLTRALNRRALFEQYAKVVDGKTRSVLHLDIDLFKRINDTYGHAAGDTVLVALVERLSTLGAPLFRLGGEEFLLLASGLDDAATATLCRRVLSAMEQAPVRIQKDALAIDVRVSIGACRYQPTGDASALEAAIQIADTGLYRAKQFGRNRAMLAEGELVSAMSPADQLTWREVLAEQK